MDFEGKLDVKERGLPENGYKKTAALIAAATKSGAIIGGGSEEQVEHFPSMGTHRVWPSKYKMTTWM